MTTMAGASGGGGLALTLVGGVLIVGALLAAQVGTATLDAQPVPAQPTVAMPPPQAMLTFPGMTVVLASTLALPEDVAVSTGAHAEERHTLEEAQAVRAAAQAAIIAEPMLGSQPPCKDGRTRIVFPMGKGAWGVWVLQKVSERMYDEVTAFRTTSQDYVRRIGDDCGNGGWWGHEYAQ